MQAVFDNLGSGAADVEKERFVGICHASLLQLTLAQSAALSIKTGTEIATELGLDPAFIARFNDSAFNPSMTTQSCKITHKAPEKEIKDQMNLAARLLNEMHHLAITYYHYKKNLDFSENPAAEANNLYTSCLTYLHALELNPFKQPLIASPSFTRLQRTASISQTDLDTLPSLIDELQEKNASSFNVLFSICNKETVANFRQTCGIPFTLLQSTAKLAKEKDCAFFFRSINPIFPLLVEEEKKIVYG